MSSVPVTPDGSYIGKIELSVFLHLDPEGRAQMIDVGRKPPQRRIALAVRTITLACVTNSPHFNRSGWAHSPKAGLPMKKILSPSGIVAQPPRRVCGS